MEYFENKFKKLRLIKEFESRIEDLEDHLHELESRIKELE